MLEIRNNAYVREKKTKLPKKKANRIRTTPIKTKAAKKIRYFHRELASCASDVLHNEINMMLYYYKR